MKPEELQLENCWQGFATAAIPENAPRGQYVAMRSAFMAGVETALQYVTALKQHAPSNLDTGIAAWRKQILDEMLKGKGDEG